MKILNDKIFTKKWKEVSAFGRVYKSTHFPLKAPLVTYCSHFFGIPNMLVYLVEFFGHFSTKVVSMCFWSISSSTCCFLQVLKDLGSLQTLLIFLLLLEVVYSSMFWVFFLSIWTCLDCANPTIIPHYTLTMLLWGLLV